MTDETYEVVADGLCETSDVQRAKDVYYHCGKCGDYIPSQPDESMRCDCGNIRLDITYVRLAVEDYSKFQVVRLVSGQ